MWWIHLLPKKKRRQLVMHMLDVEAVPLSAIVDVNEDGQLTISGRTLDIEKAKQLQVHARAALENKALALIREQVRYESYVGAAVKVKTPDELTFYRAALWWGQMEEKYLRLLAGREEPTLD